jgi:hypothetical protein
MEQLQMCTDSSILERKASVDNGHIVARLRDLILSKYNDVMRVGVLQLNGEAVTWDTSGSSKKQLQSFLSVVLAKLRALPVAAGLEECELVHAVFLFTKAVSMNFGLFHTYAVLHREFGLGCMLSSDSMEYYLDMSEAHSGLHFHAGVTWRKPGNVRALPSWDDAEVAPSIRGTLHSLHAKFCLAAREPASFVAMLGSAPCGGICSRITASRRHQRHVPVKDEQLHNMS